MHKDDQEALAEHLREVELRTPDFLTYVARPKHTEQIETCSELLQRHYQNRFHAE